MNGIHRKPAEWPKRALTFIPIQAGVYQFCLAEPAYSPATWPSTEKWPSRAVLLDLDPWSNRSATDQPELPPNRISDHRWPSDTISYARSIGLDVELADGQIPWVGREALADRPNVFIHDLVIGFTEGAKQVPSLADWQALRKYLHTTHLRSLRRLPDGCAAVHYFTEGDMSFLLTTSQEMVEQWVDSLLITEFPHLGSASEMLRLTRMPLARWILAKGEERGGIRIKTVDAITGEAGPPKLRVQGMWGKDPASLAVDIGSSEDGYFDCSLDAQGR